MSLIYTPLTFDGRRRAIILLLPRQNGQFEFLNYNSNAYFQGKWCSWKLRKFDAVILMSLVYNVLGFDQIPSAIHSIFFF